MFENTALWPCSKSIYQEKGIAVAGRGLPYQSDKNTNWISQITYIEANFRKKVWGGFGQLFISLENL